MARVNPLQRYKAKRNFDITPEPAEGGASLPGTLQFVVQKHWARRLHYDFRIELDGAMKSWAVPKGPSYDPHDKRMAMHVEDHPISYNSFEGEIPPKQYGAGKVIVWDKGFWSPIGDPLKGYREGHLKFELHGHKLHGRWALVRMHGRRADADARDAWLLIKEHDGYARPVDEFSLVDQFPDSVAALPMPEAPAAGPLATAGPRVTAKAVRNAPPKRAASGKGKGKGRPVMPAGAVEAEAPATLAPLLATLVDGPPPDPQDWLYEIKFDGYRILARIDAEGVRLFTRNGHDWTARMPRLAGAIEGMKLRHGWLDGEIVVLNDAGGTDFQALQNAFDSAKTQDIVYFLFDLPYYDGRDLRGVPLLERRALLEALVAGAPPEVRLSAIFDAPPEDIVASACRIGLEGVIGKRKNSTYASRRSPDWIKLKCARRQEFVIGGYTDPKGSRIGLGSILVGVHDEAGDLVFAGGVGAGFNGRSLADMVALLKPLETDQRPFKDRIDNERRAHWVEPVLVAEVTFSEWTQDGHVRHPVFHALRTDKPASQIVREVPMPADTADAADREERPKTAKAARAAKARSAATPVAGPASTLPANFKVSHADRVVDRSTGITKIEVVRYYALVASLMMEHLRGRPVSFVRAPRGIEGQHFFQKHLESGSIEGVRQLDAALWPAHPQLLEIASPLGLPGAAQMNVVELHTWNAVKTAIDRPDRMTFDLDPGEGVDWPMVQQAAELMRVVLVELGLVPFCKTSGGKGLHVVVPIRRTHGWDAVKDFSQAIVRHMARTLPQVFVAKSGPSNRVGRIFIDYLRNGFGATTVCAWSLRARPGMGVSVPVAWPEVPKLSGGAHWTLRDIHARLDHGNAPWAGYAKAARSPGVAMKRLGFEPPAEKDTARRSAARRRG